MKKKYKIIIGIGSFILLFFMYNNYRMIEEDLEKYRNLNNNNSNSSSNISEKSNKLINSQKSAEIKKEVTIQNKGVLTEITKEYNFEKLEDVIKYLAENLDNAKFTPIRKGWQFDYGFRDGWLLNKYEYIRSLLTYKHFQSKLKYPIYLSGPHTQDKLNLNSKYSFGHYNPKFLVMLRKSILQIMSEEDFITITKPLLKKYSILDFLKKNKDIYEITQKYPDEFDRIKLEYIKGMQNKTLSEGAYRDLVPSLLNSEVYWNWSETSYNFWIRRDIDNTKNLWIELINDVLNGYEYETALTNQTKEKKVIGSFIILYNSEKWEECIELAEDNLDLFENKTSLLLTLSRAYGFMSNFERAIFYAKQILEKEPLNYYALFNLGAYYFNLKELILAEDYYLKALSIKPSYVRVNINLALLYEEQGEKEKAIEQYLKALKLFKENNFNEEVISFSKEVLKLDPNNILAKKYLNSYKN
jgi:tetratricopeptide (TPR) repeat protein